MMKSRKIINFVLSIIVAIIIFLIANYTNLNNKVDSNKTSASLISCWDGDTGHFLIDNQNVKVRFIGIDTPEIEGNPSSLGNQASEFVCEILKNADEILLEKDPKSLDKDKFDRSLYWVWVDGKLLEIEIVKNGYGKVRYIYDDYLYVEELYEAQDYAKSLKLGIWSE